MKLAEATVVWMKPDRYWRCALLKMNLEEKLQASMAQLVGPTHHSTGPARKAAQVGEFKRYNPCCKTQ